MLEKLRWHIPIFVSNASYGEKITQLAMWHASGFPWCPKLGAFTWTDLTIPHTAAIPRLYQGKIPFGQFKTQMKGTGTKQDILSMVLCLQVFPDIGLSWSEGSKNLGRKGGGRILVCMTATESIPSCPASSNFHPDAPLNCPQPAPTLY